jgi:hypothetical protein
MALSYTSATEQPIEAPVAPQHALPSSEIALLMTAAVAGASMTKAAKKQYRKMARKAAFSMMGYKIKRMLGFKAPDVPDTIFGMNFWLFFGIVVVGAAFGAWLFGFWAFLVLIGLGVIIYLLVKDDL